MSVRFKTLHWGSVLLVAMILSGWAIQATGEGEPTDWGQQRVAGAVTVEIGEDGAVTVHFAEMTQPPTRYGIDLFAGVQEGEDPFVGDFTAAGVEGVSFNFTGDGHVPATHLAFLEGESTRGWRHEFDASDVAGEVVSNSLPLLPDSPWLTGAPGDVAAKWAEDLQHVARIGIRLQPSGMAAQSYTIDSFVLFGTGGTTPPADLRPVISAMGKAARGMRIRWRNTQQGGRYKVVRSSSVFGPFEDVEGGSGIAGDEEYMEFVDESAEDAERYFYKIIKE